MSLDSKTVNAHINDILRVSNADPLIINAFTHRYDTLGQLDAALFGLAPVIVHPIVGLYQIVFNRTPDDDGLEYWVGKLSAKSIVPSDNSVIKGITLELAASDEWSALVKGKTNAEIVTALYKQALQRAPDKPGLDFWTGELNKGRSPADLILEFASSDEFIALTTPHIEGFLRGTGSAAPAGSLFDVAPFDRTVDSPLGYEVVKERIADILRFDASYHLVDTFRERYASLDELDAALLDFSAVTVTPLIGLYQAAFGRLPDDKGLTFWRGELGDAGVELFDLGALHEIAKRFVDSNEWQHKFEESNNRGIVKAIYRQALGREEDAEGIDFWTAQLDKGVSPAELLIQFVLSDEFIASAAPHFDTLLLSAARASFPESKPLFDLTPFTLADGVLTLNLDGPYTISPAADGTAALRLLGASHILSASELNGIKGIAVEEGVTLEIASSVLANRSIAFTGSDGGAGKVNISGVTVTQATIQAPVGIDVDLRGISFGDNAPDVTVNGNVRDWILARWTALDQAYGQLAKAEGGAGAPLPDAIVVPGAKTVGEATLIVNTAFVKLAAAYADYLEDGGAPLTDFIAKASETRTQLIHDNLLGNGSSTAIDGREFPADVEAELRALLPDWVEGRPLVSGNHSEAFNADHRAALAIDWEKGFERPDYVQSADQKKIDAIGINENGFTHVGSGNTPYNYVLERHEGAGVEVGLKVHFRGGADIEPVGPSDEDGIVQFEVPTGHGAGTTWDPAVWSFDFSVLAGINGQDTTLDDFLFTFKIDIDPSAATKFVVLELRGANGNTPWIDVATGEIFIPDQEKPTTGENDALISQNSLNFGFNHIRDLIKVEEGERYNFGEGEFDIILSAATRGNDSVELASTHIVVNVVGSEPASLLADIA